MEAGGGESGSRREGDVTMRAVVIDCTGGEDSAMRSGDDDVMRGGADITGEEGRTGVGDQVSGRGGGEADAGDGALEQHGRVRITGGSRMRAR